MLFLRRYWLESLALIGVGAGGAYVLLGASGHNRIQPLAPHMEPPPLEAMDLKTSMEVPRESPPALPDPGEAFLNRVIEQLGVPDRLPNYSPHGQGRWWALKNRGPLYPNRMAAIAERLNGNQRAQLLECVSALMADGSLPGDYLMAPLEEEALIWDPVGRETAERLALYGFGRDEASAKSHFRSRFLEHWHVSQGLQPVLDFERRSKWNPLAKSVSGEALTALREIERGTAIQVRSLILQGPLLESYMDARATKFANQDYVALPFSAAAILQSCGSPEVKQDLNGVGMADGWTVHVEVKPGDYPPYDSAFQEIEGLVQARNDAIASYIQGLP